MSLKLSAAAPPSLRLLLLVMAVLAVGTLAALAPVAGLDIWWHLRTGEQLWHQPGWLAVDTLSDGAFGAAWAYKDIGADLLLYALHRALGDAGLSLLPALIAAALVLTLTLGRRAAAAPLPWVLTLGAAALAAMLHRLHARPLLFSLLAFALLLPLLERWLRRSLRARSWTQRGLDAAPLIALLWLWAWLHRGVVLGVALVVAAAGWSLIAAWWQRRRSAPAASTGASAARALTALGVAIAAVLVVCATPNGIATWTTSLGLLGGATYRAHVSEWQPLALADLLRHHGTFLLPWVAVGFAAWRRRASAQRVALSTGDVFLAVVAVGLAGAVFVSARWLPYAALAAARLALPAAALALPSAALALPAAGRPAVRASVMWGVLVVTLGWLASERPLPLQVGVLEGRYPSAALQYAHDSGLLSDAVGAEPARPINAYDFGGWLLWHAYPQLRPSIDGRADMVFAADIFAEAVAAEREQAAFAAMQRRRARTWVLARQEAGGRSHAFLASDPAWALVFWSERAVIFAQVDAHQALVAHDAYVEFDGKNGPGLDAEAFAVAGSIAGETVAAVATQRVAVAVAELDRMAASEGRSVVVAVARVVFWHGLGPSRRGERDAALDAVVAAHPGHPAVTSLLERLL